MVTLVRVERWFIICAKTKMIGWAAAETQRMILIQWMLLMSCSNCFTNKTRDIDKLSSDDGVGCSRSLFISPSNAELCSQIVRPDWPSAPERIHLRSHLLVLDLSQKRREQIPSGFQLVAADEQMVVARDYVQDKALVRIRNHLIVISVTYVNQSQYGISLLNQQCDTIVSMPFLK